MMMMMMANHAEPLDSSCTNTKYMSWVWRNGLEGVEETQWLHIAEEGKYHRFYALYQCWKVGLSESDSEILATFVSELTEVKGFGLGP